MNTLNIDGKTYELKEITSPEPETNPKEPQKPKSVWDLKPGDRYYYITDTDNDNDISWDTWDYTEVDNYRRNSGNCFFTREEAEKELAKRKAITRIKKFIHDEGMEWEWRLGVKNWDIFWGITNEDFCYTYTCSTKSYAPFGYLGSEDNVRRILATFPDELKLIYDV